ncbi:biotin-dependent carboxyltransferase family protein [Vibrio hannami]|uniref:5-oxoprolinase subunit C family protein n=1 Tax=Vibrio hannami TaxID=2717094 RepID=UPI00240EFD53|nr:biotin-dependent carboxyltransferase family protein [Vibrio hannami]MDG3085456.1 biotin-dependent carboxyltransferase family protein [Vibrio hannami]
MAIMKVVKPGQLSLIQDIGRFGISPLGVTQGGPLDEYAYCWSNLLLGNTPGCPVLEITLGQAEFTFTKGCMAAICGGDLQVKLDDKPIVNWSSFYIAKGQTLKFGLPKNGLRAYLAVAGGFIVEPHLGSTSTVMRERLGGLHQDGTPLIEGDEIRIGLSEHKKDAQQVSFRFIPDYNLPLRLRVIESYQAQDFPKETRRAFYRNMYSVSQSSDRMGYRLTGQPIAPPYSGVISEGIALGAIQIPPDGQPIVLLSDRQTLGGYPKIGVLARIDQPRLAQAKPGQSVRFIKGNRHHLQAIWNAWALRFGY